LYSNKYNIINSTTTIIFDWINLSKVEFILTKDITMTNLNICNYTSNTLDYNKNTDSIKTITPKISKANFQSISCSGSNLVYGNQILPSDFLITGINNDKFIPAYFDNGTNYISVTDNTQVEQPNFKNGDIIISVFSDATCIKKITKYPSPTTSNIYILLDIYTSLL